MNKHKFVRLVILVAIAYPLRIAYLAPTESNAVNLMCMIAVIVGVIAFVIIGPDKKEILH